MRDGSDLIARAFPAGSEDTARAAAPALWEALLDGRWTVTQRIDTAGRRFLIARRADVPSRRLSECERELLRRRLEGVSLKVMAADLGLSESTVWLKLARARDKLGLPSEADLRAVYAPPRG